MNLLLFLALYLGLGLAVFEGFRHWYAFLVRLAGQHDVATRRKIASRYYPAVAVLLLIGIYAVNICSIPLTRSLALRHHWVATLPAVALIVAVLPAFIWYGRRWKTLSALGYGRQRLQR